VRGNPPPSRQTGPGTTCGTLTGSATGGWRIGADEAAAGHLIPAGFYTDGIGQGFTAPVAAGADDGAEIVGALSPGAHPGGFNGQDAYTGQLIPTIGFGWQNAATQRDDVEVETARSLRTVTSPGVLTPDLAVRRLTPTECERLMGWPDGWTRWRADGTEIADGPRYRMCGNGVVAPVAQWIGTRMRSAFLTAQTPNTTTDKDTP
jgi:DNA (cytosine-5)-methyltransferase 1